MFTWFSDWSERTKLALSVLIVSLIALLLSMWLGGYSATKLVMLPGLFAILKVIRPAFTTKTGGGGKVALASLGIAALVVVFAGAWRPYIQAVAEPALARLPPVWRTATLEHLGQDAPSTAALVFLAVVIIGVNYFARPRPTLPVHKKSKEDEFPERRFSESLARYARALTREMDKIDDESNWTDEDFIPLDAEVEVRRSRRRRRRLTNLLTAIRRDRSSRIFLVLGDPGSGKSVALRKLCRDLLKESSATKKLPVYVNLREWEPERPWTETAPPTSTDLYQFVLANLKARADVFGVEFLDRYFKQMLDRGMLFIILDSFDEIPTVLDVDEHSWLVNALSDAIDQFMLGSHESRGIVASRLYRKPTAKLGASTVLEIRPLTERKIGQVITRALPGGGRTVRQLFHLHRELVPVARNPFTASLITAYAREHEYTLPHKQAELYEAYIARRLRACDERLQKLKLSVVEVVETARDIADVMFTTEQFGLEAPVVMLTAALPHRRIDEVIDLLVFAHLGRLGSGSSRRFSFVHRRFNEYFLVQRMRERPNFVPTESIPTDSRYRDALALYCEVAEIADASKIASFAWQHVERGGLKDGATAATKYVAAVHSLRFLADAFRGRPECLASFQSELSACIRNVLESKESGLVSKKLSVEAVGLLDEQSMGECLISAVKLKNSWIDETVFRACQFLTAADERVNLELCASIDRIPWYRFIIHSRDLVFALSLSEAFSRARWFCLLRAANLGIVAIAAAILLVISPALFLTAAVVVGILELFSVLAPSFHEMKNVMYVTLIGLAGITTSGILEAGTRPLSSLVGSTVFSFFMCFLLAPFYKVLRLPPQVKGTSLLKWVSEWSIVLLVIATFWSVFAVLGRFIPTELYSVPIASVFAVGILWQCWQGLVWLAGIAKDRRAVLQLGSPVPEISRTQIAENWNNMRTSWGRTAYTRWLREHRVRATGAWPESLPHDDGDAGTLLAQLEEGWLGLSR